MVFNFDFQKLDVDVNRNLEDRSLAGGHYCRVPVSKLPIGRTITSESQR